MWGSVSTDISPSAHEHNKNLLSFDIINYNTGIYGETLIVFFRFKNGNSLKNISPFSFPYTYIIINIIISKV